MQKNNPLIISKPKWIRVKLPTGKKFKEISHLVNKYKLNTICQSGSCPNMGECWNEGSATFMILGNICTRSCKFCGVQTGKSNTIDWEEPDKVARSIKLMNVKHAVITSVDRDNLKDMGSIIWQETIYAIKRMCPNTTIEALIPDFQGIKINIDRIIATQPAIISHNLETVKRLTREIRMQAKYERSLWVLKYLKQNGVNRTKTSIMLGLGEKNKEVLETINDIHSVNVDIITIGQYLQPSKNHFQVQKFITPEQFNIYKKYAEKLGFLHVESGPLVRSSYHSYKHVN